MNGAIRGTTPTFRLMLDTTEVDLTEARNVYATFTQDKTVITKTGQDIDILPQEVDVYLTQRETLKFQQGKLEIQLNWTYLGGKRASSDIIYILVGRNLIGRVIE